MDSMFFNKIAGASIGALLLFLLLNFFSAQIYGTRGAAHAAGGEEGPVLAYAVEVEAEAGAAEAAAPQIDLLALFRHPDIAAGEKMFRACGACHSVEAGENKVGPSLHGVVGRDIASVAGFSYSDAMLAQEGAWTPAHLFAFIHDPRAVVPGTKMSYAGMDDPADRANVIAYLNEAGGAPIDLTEGIAPLAPAASDAAAAEGGADVAAAGDAQSPAQPGVTVTDVESVDLGQENVGVGSTTPLQIEKAVPAPAAAAESGPAEQSVTAETPAGEHLTAEGPSDAPVLPAGEDVAIAPGATAPVPSGDGSATATLGGDAAAGEKLFRRCKACHKIEAGANVIGPSLHDIVGRDIATVADFEYSDAMLAQAGVWTPERLAAFLADPRGDVPGTKMAFAGLKDEQDRIDLITFLQQAAR